MHKSISVVFPAYNEEKIIAKTINYTLEVLKEVAEDFEIIVVNDASTDSTQTIIEEFVSENKRVKLINHSKNLKLGSTLKDGFAAAKKDLILYSDADMPFDMRELKKAICFLEKENADIVSAYRFDRDTEGLIRTIYSAIYNFLIRILFKIMVKDVNFAFKLFRRNILDSVHLASDGSFIMAEFLIKSRNMGFKIVQFGTSYKARSIGISRLFKFDAIIKILYEMLLFLFNRKNFMPNIADEIVKCYHNFSLRTKIHIWLRIKTCPFFRLEGFLPKNGLFLDFGCGHGIFAHLLAISSQNREILGIDISAGKVIVAAKSLQNAQYNKRIKFLVGESLEIAGLQRPDVISIIDTLYLIPEGFQEEILFRCYQRLSLKGLLLIKTIRNYPKWKFHLSYLQELLAVRILKITSGKKLCFLDETKLLLILKKIGFSVSTIDISKNYFYPHTLYLCSKN